MKKLITIIFFVMSINIYSEDLNTYGIKWNSTDQKNEVWRLNKDNTETLLLQFSFPSGGWKTGNSYADQKTGKLWLYDGGSGITEEEKGWVVYDPSTNTIETGVKEGYAAGFQKTFQSVLELDEIIKNETDSSGDKSSVIGSDELVASSGTTIIANGTDSRRWFVQPL